MKTTRTFLVTSLLAITMLFGSSCKLWSNVFGPKYGCPANGRSVGAERLTLRTDFGCTEAIIDDDCGLKRFYEVANILSDDLEIRFTQKEDDFDTLTWNFAYKNHVLTLHYNIYTGISIYPFKFREAPRKDNDAVIEVAKFLENKLMIHSAKKYMS